MPGEDDAGGLREDGGLSILYLRCCLRQPARHRKPQRLPATLSILYLRCKVLDAEVYVAGEYPFNSLFEMP